MCSVKTPKPPPQPVNSQKQPVYMRNSYLDGLGINSENAGRNSLRIDLGSGPAPRPPTVVLPPIVTPPGGRGRGGGGGVGLGLGVGTGGRGGLGLVRNPY